MAKKRFDQSKYTTISSDTVRGELWGDSASQKEPKVVFEEVRRQIFQALANKENVIYDATNLRRKHREPLIEEAKKQFGAEVFAYIIVAPYGECIKRNLTRSRKVPSPVIYRHFCSFEMPVMEEGYTKIGYTRDYENYYDPYQLYKSMQDFDQDNPNHSLFLGEHVERTSLLVAGESPIMQFAGLFHDVGKLFTQTYTNFKGEIAKEAHYYGHENYGSYLSLMLDRTIDKIEVAQLICYHMIPYSCTTEKAKAKWERKLGTKMWNQILTLHEADRAAH